MVLLGNPEDHKNMPFARIVRWQDQFMFYSFQTEPECRHRRGSRTLSFSRQNSRCLFWTRISCPCKVEEMEVI